MVDDVTLVLDDVTRVVDELMRVVDDAARFADEVTRVFDDVTRVVDDVTRVVDDVTQMVDDVTRVVCTDCTDGGGEESHGNTSCRAAGERADSVGRTAELLGLSSDTLLCCFSGWSETLVVFVGA